MPNVMENLQDKLADQRMKVSNEEGGEGGIQVYKIPIFSRHILRFTIPIQDLMHHFMSLYLP